MNDSLRRSRADGACQRRRIENIDHDRLGAELAQIVGLVGRPRGADDAMPGRAQQRREFAPDGSAGAGQKYFHAAVLYPKKEDVDARHKAGHDAT
jgi:hypothetical protein